MKQYVNTLSFVAIVIVIVIFVPNFCAKQTDAFSCARLQSAFPNDPRWNTTSLSQGEEQEFAKAIQQPYHYLASGGQCFAFESEDKRYVIKFFKHKMRTIQQWLLTLPFPEPLASKQRKIYNRLLSKHQRDFNSYTIADHLLKQQTGLIYAHLNKTKTINKKLTIYDKLHISHQIDLDQTEFILQKKADLVYPSLDAMMKEGNLEEAKRAIRSILQLIVSRCQHGVFDEDPRIHCNIGLIGTEAIFIDIGRFKQDPERIVPQVYLSDIVAITERFKGWLAEKHPTLVPVLEKEIASLP